jgi:lipopolysaccharide export system protein LptA
MGGFAHLSSVDGSWLSAGKIVYDMKSGVANATGGVTMENKPQKMTGSGDRAVYNSNETGYIELIGNAKATQDGNTVTGDKLRITNVSGPDSKTHAQGNVTLVYYPKEENENVNNPAFGEGAVLMANGETNFNPESNMLDRIKKNDFATEDKTV